VGWISDIECVGYTVLTHKRQSMVRELSLPAPLPLDDGNPMVLESYQRFFKGHDRLGRSSCQLKNLMSDVLNTKRCDEAVTAYDVYRCVFVSKRCGMH
jgi:hypothetical protein